MNTRKWNTNFTVTLGGIHKACTPVDFFPHRAKHLCGLFHEDMSHTETLRPTYFHKILINYLITVKTAIRVLKLS